MPADGSFYSPVLIGTTQYQVFNIQGTGASTCPEMSHIPNFHHLHVIEQLQSGASARPKAPLQTDLTFSF